MVAYTKPQQRQKEENEQLRGERDEIKFIDLRFERWQVVGLRKALCWTIPKLGSEKTDCNTMISEHHSGE